MGVDFGGSVGMGGSVARDAGDLLVLACTQE